MYNKVAASPLFGQYVQEHEKEWVWGFSANGNWPKPIVNFIALPTLFEEFVAVFEAS